MLPTAWLQGMGSASMSSATASPLTSGVLACCGAFCGTESSGFLLPCPTQALVHPVMSVILSHTHVSYPCSNISVHACSHFCSIGCTRSKVYPANHSLPSPVNLKIYMYDLSTHLAYYHERYAGHAGDDQIYQAYNTVSDWEWDILEQACV